MAPARSSFGGAAGAYRCLPVLDTGTLELGLDCGAEVGAGEEVAVGAFERMIDERLRPPGVRDAGVELRGLSLGQATPVPVPPAPGGEQPTDLREREPGFLAEANQRDALRARRLVVPPPSGTPGGRQQADPLVVTERRSRNPRAASQFPDRHQVVLLHGRPLDLKRASTSTIFPHVRTRGQRRTSGWKRDRGRSTPSAPSSGARTAWGDARR